MSSYIVKLERLRALLASILSSKGKTVQSDEAFDTLIPLVNGIGVNDTIAKILGGSEAFDLIDTDNVVTVINSNVLKGGKVRVVEIPAVSSISSYAFESCNLLTKAIIGTENENRTTLFANVFNACTALEKVTLNWVTFYAWVFNNCSSLKIVKCNKTSIADRYVFTGCNSLKIVDFGVIEGFNNGQIFNSSAHMKAVVIRNTEVAPISGTNIFAWLDENVADWYFYVPDDLVDSYKVANIWSNYSARFKPLSEYDEEAILNGIEEIEE